MTVYYLNCRNASQNNHDQIWYVENNEPFDVLPGEQKPTMPDETTKINGFVRRISSGGDADFPFEIQLGDNGWSITKGGHQIDLIPTHEPNPTLACTA